MPELKTPSLHDGVWISECDCALRGTQRYWIWLDGAPPPREETAPHFWLPEAALEAGLGVIAARSGLQASMGLVRS